MSSAVDVQAVRSLTNKNVKTSQMADVFYRTSQRATG